VAPEVGDKRSFGAKRWFAVLSAAALVCGAWLALAATPAMAQGSGYFVTFAARVCPDYTDIFANKARNNIVESLKDLGPDTQYGTSGVLVNPAYEDQPPQTLCQPLPGWQFTLGTNYESRAVTGVWGSLSKVTNPYSTQIVTQSSTPLLDDTGNPVPGQTLAGATTVELTSDQRAQASNSSLWVQGGTPTDPVLAQPYPGPEYGFGTIRCATDNVNGDNVEYVFFPTGVRHVFCYAYYVKPPPTTGVIMIRKQVTGTPTGANPSFPFNGTISFDPTGFQLTDGGSMTFYRAGGSSWTVTEGPVANYTVASLVCVNAAGTPVSTFDISGGTATIHLAALGNVTCTYTNQFVPPSGGLTIRKITRNGVGQFEFDVTPVSGGASHTVTATTTQENVPVNAVPSLEDLAPGTYTIDEHTPVTRTGHWNLDSVNCNNVSRSSTHSFQVTIVSGQQLTCVFTNSFTPAGSISIAKVTQGALGTVGFVVQPLQGRATQYLQSATTTAQGTPAYARPRTPADATHHLPLGSYRVIEETPPSTPAGAWQLVSVVCDQQLLGFGQGATVVTLTPDQPSVRCVYTDLFTPTPAPEPGPQPPEPLPPEPTPQPTPEPNPDEPSATWTDLSVTKTASPPTAIVGGVVTYRITVRNHGPNDATRVVVNDKPAAGAVVLSAHSSVGHCSVRQKLLPVECQLGTMQSGAKVTITVRVRVTKKSSRYKNTVAAGTATYDPILSNNVAHATVAVVAPPPPAVTG
jgi:uncharacterized repeat protein (TIGR01451 family)